MSAIDWRGLCEELVEALEIQLDELRFDNRLCKRARAALAQPELEVAGLGTDSILALAAIIREVDGNHSLGAAALAEAILSHPGSHWGRPAPVPAGEVGELVADHAAFAAWLAREMPPGTIIGDPRWAPRIARRAASLLKLQAAPVPLLPEGAQVIEPAQHTILAPAPVPVAPSERPWEREGWCDEEGRCWWFDPKDPGWVFDDATTCRHWSDFSLPHNAQPEPEVAELSDEELDELFIEIDQSGESLSWRAFARAAIAADRARYGRPAPALAGEVGELARSLHHASDALRSYALHGAAEACTRAADLLSIAYATGPEVWEPIAQLPQQRHPAPVPVAERPWEREGWCDEQGRCWFCNAYSMGRWTYEDPPDPEQDWGRLGTFTHSLPHGAIPRPLPLPGGEVEG